MDNNTPRDTAKPLIGEDLYGLSLSELEQRIADYGAEIIRLKAEIAKKSSERSAAEALFGKNT